MERRKLDYLIIGQGLAGSWLAYELAARGKKILVLNDETERISTLKAAGLYNPITGRNMIKTWLADEIFQHLEERYRSLEQKTGTRFLYPIPIYRPFVSIEEKNDWDGKIENPTFMPYVDSLETKSIYDDINDQLGGIILKKTGYVNLPEFILAMRKYLVSIGAYQVGKFDYQQLVIEGSGARYKEWDVSQLIFCEGVNPSNHFWGDLPFKNVRGELIDVSCELKSEHIINRGVFMIPKDGYFTVGSTYDHKILSFEPQEKGINDLSMRLG
ncbi:MAG: FAD-dependent oxidoreductase, partial [Bacteroidota bacterium]